MNHIGTHYIWDVKNINPSQISYQKDVEDLLHCLNASTDLAIVGENYKQFDPVGVTGVLLLSESHFSIHTWPEHNYAALDLFSCRPIDHQKISDLIAQKWPSCEIKFKILERGVNINKNKSIVADS